MTTTRVFIYEPERAFSPEPESIILKLPEVQLIGVADDLEHASQVTHNLFNRIDVMLVSCSATSRTEIDVIRQVQPLRTLILSHAHDDDSVVAALSAGARGYMTEIPSSRDLLRAIQLVESGGAVFCRTVAQRLSAYCAAYYELPCLVAFPDLTDREREILDLIARGLSNRQISRKLVVADKTVRNHITQIFAKIEVSNRAAAIVKARNAGIGISWTPAPRSGARS